MDNILTITKGMQRKGSLRKNGRFVILSAPYCYKCFSKDKEEAFNRELSILTEARSIPGVCQTVNSGTAKDGENEYLCIQMNLYTTRWWESVIIEGSEKELCFQGVKEVALNLLTPLIGLEKLGIIHNDIAPSNIAKDRKGNFILIDFGSAKHLSEEGHSELQEGHPGYTAPEKCSSGITSIHSDMYSFGKLLDGLIGTGRSLDIDYPADFIRIIEKCCETQPEDRFGSFMDVAEAIEHIMESVDDSAAPISESGWEVVETAYNNTSQQIYRMAGCRFHMWKRVSSVSFSIFKMLVLVASSLLLASSIYMAVRPYSDSPEEQDALKHPSVIKDYKIIKADFNINKQKVKHYEQTH